MRPEAPLLIETADLGHPKCRAINVTNSLFALPSTGGDFSCASQGPFETSARALTRALGFTLTWMILMVRLGNAELFGDRHQLFGESKPRVDVFPSEGEGRAFWREISRGRENLGPGFSSGSCGGLHELFASDYEVPGPKLKRTYDFSHFFRQREGPGG